MSVLFLCDRDHSLYAHPGDGGLSTFGATVINRCIAIFTQEMEKRGDKVAIVSGNDFDTIKSEIERLGWYIDSVSSKCGTEIWHSFGGEWLLNEGHRQVMLNSFNNGKVRMYVMQTLAEVGASFLPHPPEKNGPGKESGFALFDKAYSSESVISTALDGIADFWDVKVQSSAIKDEVDYLAALGWHNVKNLDVLSINAGKGVAGRNFIDRYRPAQIVVLVDSMNDVELAELAQEKNGTVLLPSNASDELEAYCTRILPSHQLYNSPYPAGLALLDWADVRGLIDINAPAYEGALAIMAQYI